MSNTQLFTDSPLTFSPTVAKYLGLNQAIVLQQLHYWLCKNREKNINHRVGTYWCYESYTDWQERSFPFWSIDTIKRTFLSLEKKGIILSRQFDKHERKMRKWYTINYDTLNNCLKGKMQFTKTDQNTNNYHLDKGKLPSSIGANCPDDYNIYSNIENSIYTETNTENNNKCNQWSISEEMPDTDASVEDVIKNQVIKACNAEMLTDQMYIDRVIWIVMYYCRTYREVMGISHPMLNQECMDKVVRGIIYGTDSDIIKTIDEYVEDDYEVLIDQHFKTHYRNCDYNILHFVSGKIRDLRGFETGVAY